MHLDHLALGIRNLHGLAGFLEDGGADGCAHVLALLGACLEGTWHGGSDLASTEPAGHHPVTTLLRGGVTSLGVGGTEEEHRNNQKVADSVGNHCEAFSRCVPRIVNGLRVDNSLFIHVRFAPAKFFTKEAPCGASSEDVVKSRTYLARVA